MTGARLYAQVAAGPMTGYDALAELLLLSSLLQQSAAIARREVKHSYLACGLRVASSRRKTASKARIDKHAPTPESIMSRAPRRTPCSTPPEDPVILCDRLQNLA
jgi:hypothetical protein